MRGADPSVSRPAWKWKVFENNDDNNRTEVSRTRGLPLGITERTGNVRGNHTDKRTCNLIANKTV